MMLVIAFADFVQLAEKDQTIKDAFDSEIQSRVFIALFQGCFRTLLNQKEDGSWNDSVEQTSYGILILSEARRLSFFQDKDLLQHISFSINRAVRFISATDKESDTMDPIWIEKVTYGSTLLTSIYRLAALKSAASINFGMTPAIPAEHKTQNNAKMRSYVGLFLQTPLFAGRPAWEVRGAYFEAALFRPLLGTQWLATFPRTNMSEDKYFDIIPLTWIMCNYRGRTFASTSFLFEMMIISFLNYQADDFMEAVAGPCFEGNTQELRRAVCAMFELSDGVQSANRKQDDPSSQNGNGILLNPATGSIAPLSKFIDHALKNPQVANASKWDRRILATELQVFLLAHITQYEDNERFRRQHMRGRYNEPDDTYFKWVRTTSADHTSCPYSFAFVSCLISASLRKGAKCFPTVTQDYYANTVCHHLATMCRMYNDYGSIPRDAVEQNLNSINFPEFDFEDVGTDDKKHNLFQLAQLERTIIEESFRCLEVEVDALALVSEAASRVEKRKLSIFRMFCDVTDLYGQLYVVKDLGIAINTDTNGEHKNK
jgi:hypothetical protein